MSILSDLLKEGYFRAIFVALCAGALVMALIPQPPRLPIDQFGDKFAHILAFAVLALFARLGCRAARDRTILERMSFMGALIEVFQAIPALHRDCDWRDWLADTLAVAGVLLVLRLVPWRRLTAAAQRG